VGILRRFSSRGQRAGLYAGAVFASAALGVATFGAVRAISVDRVEAVWTIDGEVGELSQAIPVRAAHPGCPSWSNLGGLVVTAVEASDTVTLTASFPEHDEDTPCAWMGNAMRVTIKLEEPLGDRDLIDGATGKDPATPATIAFHTGQSPVD